MSSLYQTQQSLLKNIERLFCFGEKGWGGKLHDLETQRCDDTGRMKRVKPFYKSAAWLKLREYVLTRDHYLCQECLRNGKITTANTVHHIIPIEEDPDLALDADNCESICPTCHNKMHPEKGRGKQPKKKRRAKIIEVKPNPEVW